MVYRPSLFFMQEENQMVTAVVGANWGGRGKKENHRYACR